MDPVKERVAKLIAGDITLSDRPNEALKRWREIFNLSQKTLAEALKVSPSFISDYESGRRKSPGTTTIKRIVETLIRADEERGGKMILAFKGMFGAHFSPDIILGITEFKKPINGQSVCRAVNGRVVANRHLLNRKLFGYTVIDSYKAVMKLSVDEFKQLYGLSSERALVFTRVTTGRTPMVAVKVIGITPGMVVLHGPLKRVDPLGIRLAESLHVPLVHSHVPSVDELLEKLRHLE